MSPLRRREEYIGPTAAGGCAVFPKANITNAGIAGLTS